MYYTKNIGNYNYSIGGSISYSEETGENVITTNANTVSSNLEENRIDISNTHKLICF